MEVSNQMMDQMLVNAGAPAPASQSVNQPKDAERPDFDSMVHQKRSMGERKDSPKAQKAVPKEGADAQTPAEEAPVADEQYAIAAALMFQAQPDARYAAIQAEAPEFVAGAVQTLDAGTAEEAEAELPRLPVEEDAEAPEVSLPQMPVQAGAEAAPAEGRLPIPVRTDAAPEAAEAGQPEQQIARPEADAPRAEEAPETPRFARSEARPEAEDDTGDEAAQAIREMPLFERVEAAPVKVAEAPNPIPLEAEDGAGRLGNEIGNIVVNDVDANRIEVTLTPENLGRLTVELTRGEDGTLNVVLHAENERTANLLARGMDGLRQALTATAEREVQVQVRGNEEAQQQFLNPDGQNRQGRQQQQNDRRPNRRNEAQDFLQQLRLGLVGTGDNET